MSFSALITQASRCDSVIKRQALLNKTEASLEKSAENITSKTFKKAV
jgi:hypothetical protein